MCGISAYLDLKPIRHDSALGSPTEPLETRLKNSAQSMRHRGPDNTGTWTSLDDTVGLAHVRLGTRDLSAAGNQPLHSTSQADNIHVVVNGELYYDESLRKELEGEYFFQSNSDSEMVIPLYKRYGPDFVKQLRGEFALVIYDGRNDTFVLARDRFGVKPLHYGLFDGKLLVATQCKGIAALMDERLRWDATCVAQGGGHYGPRTLFEGIKKVPTGSMAVVRRGEMNGEIRFEPYYQTPYAANKGGNDERSTEQLVSELRAHLFDAVRLRTDATDVPVGLLLSGGVDSSAVAGIAAHLGKRPTCFTIAFPDDHELDESSIAERTAKHLGLDIEKVVVDEETLADEFDEACWRGEALMWDLQHIAKKALARHISSRGLRVVLNGDGGDELFGGYSYFVLDRLQEEDLLRSKDLQQTSDAERELLRERREKETQWFGMERLQGVQVNVKAKELNLPPAFSKLAVATYHSWLQPSVRSLSDPFDAIKESLNPAEIASMTDLHPLRRAMLAWNKTALPNIVIAAISDGAEMSHAVESRPPFLDHVLADFAAKLPVDVLVHLPGADQAPVEKWIFREAVKPYVTEEIYARRKHVFAAPFRWKEGGPLHRKFSELITRENLADLGFVDADKALDILDRSFREMDGLVFREALWLAQIISMGKQFAVKPWVA